MLNKQQVIEINSQPIPLCQLLKIANLVSGGGEAKIIINQGYVRVNGEVEYQKRKKIIHGDSIELNGEHFCVTYKPESIKNENNNSQKRVLSDTHKTTTKQNKLLTKKSSLQNDERKNSSKTNRKPISF